MKIWPLKLLLHLLSKVFGENLLSLRLIFLNSNFMISTSCWDNDIFLNLKLCVKIQVVHVGLARLENSVGSDVNLMRLTVHDGFFLCN